MIKKLLSNKNLLLSVAGIICGVLLIFNGVNATRNEIKNDVPVAYESDELQTYTAALEKKISDFLEKVGGISNVSVIVTVESSAETVYATEGNNSDYVIIKDSEGSENAIPLTEITAKLRGIAVVCDYGKNEQLKSTVIELLSSLFDLGSNHIAVLPA